MATRNKNHQRWLWQDMTRLSGVDRCRGIDESEVEVHLDDSPLSWSVLGRERHFAKSEFVDHLLSCIGERFRLEPDIWTGQWPFLRQFFSTFFRDKDDPAWMRLSGARKSFHQRMPDEGRVKQSATLNKRFCDLAELPGEDLWLNGVTMKGRWLRYFHPRQGEGVRVSVRRIFLHRSLAEDRHGRAISASVEWIVPTALDFGELRSFRRGWNRTLERFRDEETGNMLAPLLVLCRLAARGRYVEYRGLSLRPWVGDIIDLRTGSCEAEYYFRSQMTKHCSLERLITPGQYSVL